MTAIAHTSVSPDFIMKPTHTQLPSLVYHLRKSAPRQISCGNRWPVRPSRTPQPGWRELVRAGHTSPLWLDILLWCCDAELDPRRGCIQYNEGASTPRR